MANEISFVEIISGKSKELGTFYQKVFGWEIIPPAGKMEYRLLNTNASNNVMAAVGDPFINDESWLTFYVKVDNIDGVLENVIKNGGMVKVPKYSTDTGFTLAYFLDSNGNMIGLTEN